MPHGTEQAVEWALDQEGVAKDGQIDRHALVEHVRQYFNDHNIAYETFSAVDLEAYLSALV